MSFLQNFCKKGGYLLVDAAFLRRHYSTGAEEMVVGDAVCECVLVSQHVLAILSVQTALSPLVAVFFF